MKKLTRIAALALCLALLCAVLPQMRLIAHAETLSGSCGENLTWTLDTESGLLTIEGSGDMTDYGGGGPWCAYYSGVVTELSLPDGLTSIGDNAFFECVGLTSVTIPEGVTNVGNCAFEGCTGLKSVTFPESLTTIEGSAFIHCSALETVTIPAGVSKIEGTAFGDCVSLTEINVAPENTYYCSLNGVLFDKARTVLLCYPAGKADVSYAVPKGVQWIYEEAFEHNASLVAVSIPESVQWIDMAAFCNCDMLAIVNFEEGMLEQIYDYAFLNCGHLRTVKLPTCLTDIGYHSFGYCYWEESCKMSDFTILSYPGTAAEGYAEGNGFAFVDLTNPVVSGTCSQNLTWSLNLETGLLTVEGSGEMGGYGAWAPWCETYNDFITAVSLPDGLTNIGNGAFYFCNALKHVNVPESVTEIGNIAFSGCRSLESVTLPESLTTIGLGAFSVCSSLKTVTIPAGVREIERLAFNDCAALTEINVAAENQNYASVDGVLFDKARTVLLCYPAGKADVSYAVPEGVSTVDGSAFEYNRHLRSVSFPKGLSWIDSYAFSGCTGLTGVSFEEGPLGIADCAFENCKGLTELTLPKGLTEIGWGAFSGCVNLASVSFPEGLTYIWHQAFSDCALRSVTIPASVTRIGNSAFGYFVGEEEYEKVKGFELHGVKGSVAQSYAEANGFTFVAEQPAVSFTDVGEADYFFTPVAWAVSGGVTAGMGDGSFGANNVCTREQIVTFLWKACGAPKAEAGSCDFSDVQPGSYYYDAVLWAEKNYITAGMDDGTFGVGKPCTRAQAMTFLWVSQDRPNADGSSPFTDVEDGMWYSDPIRWAVANGVTAGMGDGSFGVNLPCTRAQIITFLYKAVTIA